MNIGLDTCTCNDLYEQKVLVFLLTPQSHGILKFSQLVIRSCPQFEYLQSEGTDFSDPLATHPLTVRLLNFCVVDLNMPV
ncbi:hypothetical protein V3C99_017269 [Haemonchus contortus]